MWTEDQVGLEKFGCKILTLYLRQFTCNFSVRQCKCSCERQNLFLWWQFSTRSHNDSSHGGASSANRYTVKLWIEAKIRFFTLMFHHHTLTHRYLPMGCPEKSKFFKPKLQWADSLTATWAHGCIAQWFGWRTILSSLIHHNIDNIINIIIQIIHNRCTFGVAQAIELIPMKQPTMFYSVSIPQLIYGPSAQWVAWYRLLVLDILPVSSTISYTSLVALISTRVCFFKTSISSI